MIFARQELGRHYQEVMAFNLDYCSSAVGQQDVVLKKALNDFLSDFYFVPISREWTTLMRFERLKEKWQEETAFLSSISDIINNTNYKKIIAMGEFAIPYIMHDLEECSALWFWALKEITGEDPVLPEQRGKIVEMRKSWINWGREKGYIC